MNLCNIYQYQAIKTVKLSDSYVVELILNKSDSETILPFLGNYYWKEPYGQNELRLLLPNCTTVNLPKIEFKEEVFTYGNNSRTYLIPDYDSPEDLKITLLESLDATNIFLGEKPNDKSQPTGIIELLVNLFLSKLFDTEKFSYKYDDYINELNIYILSNNFKETVYKYHFQDLKLTDYSKYTLDYSNANPCSWELSFAYSTYTYDTFAYTDPSVAAYLEAANLKPKTDELNPTPETPPTDGQGNGNAEDVNPPAPPAEQNEQPQDDKSKPKDEGITPPGQHSADDIDELAYKIMRGELGNGKKHRAEEAAKMGFTQEEYDAAQKIVNGGKWGELRDRHNAREASSGVDAPVSDSDSNIDPETMRIKTELKGDLQPPELAAVDPVDGEANRQAEAEHREQINAGLHQDLLADDLAMIVDEPSRLPTPEEQMDAGIIPPGAHTSDQIDELAYQMMRGNLGNGADRIAAAGAAGFSDEEIKQAQSIVNEKKWDELRDRHNARPQLNDINNGNYSDAPAPEDLIHAEDIKLDLELKGEMEPPKMPEAEHVDAAANREAEAAHRDEINQTLKLNPLDDLSDMDEIDRLGNQTLTPPAPIAQEEQKPAAPAKPAAYSDLRSEEGQKTAAEFAKSKEGYQEALGKIEKVRDEEFMDGWFVTGRYDEVKDNPMNSYEYTTRNNVIERRRTDLATKEGLDYNKEARLQAEDEWAQGKLGDYYK